MCMVEWDRPQMTVYDTHDLHADNQEYRHTLRIYNTPCFCMATVDMQMCLIVTLYVLPCLVFYCHIALSEH